MIHRHLIAPVWLILGALPLSAQSPMDSVRALDSAMARSYAVHDTMTAKALFARTIVVTGASGALKTREQELDDIRPASGLVMRYFRTRNVDIHVYGNSASLVGDAEWEFTLNGQTRSVSRRYTATYSRGGTLGWEIAALHFFPAPAAGTAAAASIAPASVPGRWEGALGQGAGRLRLVLEISRSADGLLLGTLTSNDQGSGKIPIARVRQTGDSLRLDIPVIGGTYDGILNQDRTELSGTFTQQGQSMGLTLTRTAASAPATASAPASAPPSPFGLLLDLDVPARPTVFAGSGKRHIAYEVHITNFTGAELSVSRLEVLSGTTTLASYEGAELAGILHQPRLDTPDNRTISAGVRAIAFVWLTIDSAAKAPTSIRHRVSARGQVVEGAAIPVASTSAVVIGAPLRGPDWLAANGPGNASGHRRALIALAGHPAIAQRFAIDWMKTGSNRSTFNGDALDNKAYYAYGADAIAVGDGIVSAIHDGIPENVPGLNSRAVPITTETIGGNYVIVDLGGRRYAFYAHLQPGSLRVKAGDRVRRGQVLGLVGNSGNSTEPHLHFHISDAPSPLGSEGLPYVIDSWEAKTGPDLWERQRNQLPMLNELARFASPTPPSKPD